MTALKHEAELCLPRVKPRWGTLAELVRDLGCRIVPVGLGPFVSLYEVVPPNLVRGEPSSYHCLLLKSGQIAVNAVTPQNVMDAVHEALHHRLGPWSFRHETAMLPIELEHLARKRLCAAKQAILDREAAFEKWLDSERRHAYERAAREQSDSGDKLVFLSESDAFDEALHYLRTGERKYVAGSEPDES